MRASLGAAARGRGRVGLLSHDRSRRNPQYLPIAKLALRWPHSWNGAEPLSGFFGSRLDATRWLKIGQIHKSCAGPYPRRPVLRRAAMDAQLLRSQVAVVHGGGGAIGGAIARVFGREGACVCVTGRTSARLEAVVADIVATGGKAEAAVLDLLQARDVTAHACAVAERHGRLDIVVNAIGVDHVQGVLLAELSLDDFMQPVDFYLRTSFNAAKASAPHLSRSSGGVVMTLAPPGARLTGVGWLGHGVAFSGVETFTRLLAAELGAVGVRTICLMPDAVPEALPRGSHTRTVFARIAEQHRTTPEEMLAERAQRATLLGRLPTLEQVAETAAFYASNHAQAITGVVVNLTCGSLTG